MKGRWLPVKALGTAKDSSGVSSFSMSSKLLVSTSLDNSGITGGTAEIKHSNQSEAGLIFLDNQINTIIMGRKLLHDFLTLANIA